MRKLKLSKEEQNIKKFKKSLSPFYQSWLNHPSVTNAIKKVGKNQIEMATAGLKAIVDKAYLILNAEGKYEFYTVMYEIYDELNIYFGKKDKILEKYNQSRTNKLKENEEDLIEKTLGYEVAFSKEINKKADDCLHWLYSSINKFVYSGYIDVLKDGANKRIIDSYSKNLNNISTQYSRKEKAIQKEIDIMNDILKKIKYARDKISVVYKFQSEEEDKKLRAMFKSALTRTEKLINLIINEIEGAYI